MGNRKSRPIVYPPLDPMFIPIGCTGLLRKEYDYPRLDLAPFLYYRIKVATYSELITRILELMRTLPPMDTDPPEPANPEDLNASMKRIHGPVYLFVAFDPEQRFIEGYLYFPSMTKDRRKWHSYHFLGISHNWMYRLLFNPNYNILLPNTNCAMRYRDPQHTPALEFVRVAKENELRRLKELVKNLENPSYTPPRPMGGRGGYQPISRKTRQEQLQEAKMKIPQLEKDIAKMYDIVKSMGMMLGCRTEMSYNCVQSKKAHKMMRIYRRRKPIDKYPAAYFRVYQLNLDDPRLASYVEDNTMKTVRRDILPSGVDMFPGCGYMLVSPNSKYFMLLSNYWLTIFWNYGNENLHVICRFNGIPMMSMPIKTIRFSGQLFTHLIIEDDVLNVYSEIFEQEYNVYSKQIAPENTRAPYALMLQDNGTLILYDSTNKVVSSNDGLTTSLMHDPNNLNQNIDDYDPAADYRQRIINLIAYLRMYNLYKEILENKDTLPKDVAMYVLQEGIPPYNAEIDYRDRLQRLVQYLIAKGYTNLIEKAVKKTDATTSAQSTNANTTPLVPPKVPAKGDWQQPSGDINPHADADVQECAGLEDEALANCLDFNENNMVLKEAEIEQNAQTSEYKLIDSDDPMIAAVGAEKEGVNDASNSNTMGTKPFSEEEYQKAVAICRVSTSKKKYMPNQDLYCRIIALKEYLRKRGYKVVDVNEIDSSSSNNLAKINAGAALAEYNQPVDFASRLQATRSLFTKTKGNT